MAEVNENIVNYRSLTNFYRSELVTVIVQAWLSSKTKPTICNNIYTQYWMALALRVSEIYVFTLFDISEFSLKRA